MKKLPFLRRPWFARTVLEIGGGHAPYLGVTHAVDKFPDDDSQRAGALRVAPGVTFRQGDIEAIPFEPEPKFDFLYASHILEHVNDPRKAISEINRVARKGYIEVPAPLREQLGCPYPYDPSRDFHTYFCWTASEPNTLHVLKKSAATVGSYCDCPDGRAARRLFEITRKQGIPLEALLPRRSKEAVLFFRAPVRLQTHGDFASACRAGACAYTSMRAVHFWTAIPMCLVAPRLQELRRILRTRDQPGSASF